MAKLGLLAKLGIVGLFGLGSVTTTSCHKTETPTIPSQRTMSVGTVQPPIGYEWKDNKLERKEETKTLIQESPKYPISETAQLNKTSNSENRLSQRQIQTESAEWKAYAEPYFGMKFALNSEDNPNPMPVMGVKVGAKDRRSEFYAGAEYGEMDESETTSNGYLDLKSKATKLRLGAGYDFIPGDKFTLNVSGGPALTLEDNKITGRVGGYDVNDSKKENIISLEVGLQAEYKFNDKASLTAGATYGHNFADSNSNVKDEVTGRVGLKINF